MSARKRKLGAVINASTELPESLQYTPVPKVPIAPTPKKIKTVAAAPARVDVLVASAGLLQMQADGLLETLRPRQKDLSCHLAAMQLAKDVEGLIKDMPTQEAKKIDALLEHAKKNRTRIPFSHEPPSDLQLNFEFEPPTTVMYSTVLMRHQPPLVELYATIPARVIQEKDYLNHRIFYKQAFYLYWLKSHLPAGMTASFEDGRLIIVRDNVRIQVVAAIDEVSFPVSKLEASKNADRSVEGPTPDYNQEVLCLQATLTFKEKENAIRARLSSYDDSLRLAHRFLSLRDLPISLSQWSWATCQTLEAKQKVPNSPLALFRATLQYMVTLAETTTWDALHQIRSNEMQRLYLQYECNLVLNRLNSAGSEAFGIEQAFANLFLRRVANAAHFDATFHVPGTVDCAKLYRVVKRATPGRVSLIHVQQEADGARLGLLFDDEKLVRSGMVLGPAANTEDANQFRAFWGPESELRKFKDGRILETVMLSSKDPLLSLLQHVLKLHMQCSIERIYDQFDEASIEQEAQIAQQRMAEFEEIARLAREAEDLPLRITTVSRTSSAFGPHATLDGVIVFESSARWPDHIPAIQRTKIALLLSCQRSFSAIPGVVRCQVGLEQSKVTLYNGESLSNLSFLQVQAESGSLYNLRVQFDREYTLLENESKKAQPDKTRYMDAMRDYKSLYVTPTLHRQSIANVASKHPMFASTVRLLSRWVSAHLLSRHFPQHLIELLAAHALSSEISPFAEPKSLFSSFFRVIQFLAHWDWRQEPVVAELDQSLTQAQRDALQERFKQIRHSDPAMQLKGLLAYGAYDLATDIQVDRVAALRMTQLARASFDLLGEHGADLFKTPLTDFDIVLKLKHGKVYKNISSENPVNKLFVDDLEALFGDTFLVFGGDGHAIGLMLRPELRDPTTQWRFRVNLGFNAMPVKSEGDSLQVKLNIQGTLDEILRMGEGIISDVDVHMDLP
ncbi:Nrap protein-domain-containing protein [Protomyces lactucae-debilis]|uniref:U3 small nucleolar RNA-associated protein 22 n=1 Tax=Protomyces lactucae-debilis TaxID=2754530 RepID=A0A1Y2EQP9_PROLT|nr:Nrap protein-domain-containing protein [Protomyces lactucae-debilis]ORY73911.1 Nrap protein-domain-containing protein [Protomyces lactucae-debilis]